MFRGEYGVCQQGVSEACRSHNGETSWIVNRSRYACQPCNDQIKAEKKKSRRKRSQFKPESKPKPGQVYREQLNAFYRAAWDSRSDNFGRCRCEECGWVLKEFSPAYISHILSRGAYRALALDMDNFNILCIDCHREWETGNRSAMNIYSENQRRIEQLFERYRLKKMNDG